MSLRLFVCIQLNDFLCCYLILIIVFDINQLFAHSQIVSRIAISVQLIQSHHLPAPLKLNRIGGTCLLQEQFEESGWDTHICARAWHD